MHASHFLAPLFLAATTLAQAVEEGIAPSTPPPSGCQVNADGNFTIGTLKVGHHAKRESAMEAADGALVCTLKDGILRDSYGRTGSVVANHQFQFDGPPQAGAIYTGGFSICTNGSLAIGGTTQWWQCLSGGFYNLYDEWIGAQCEEIRIQATFPQKPSSSSSVSPSSATVPIASIASSLITITGAVSTVSASAVGPSASFSSGSSNVTITSGASSGVSSPTSSTTRGLAAGSSSTPGATNAAPAPAAGGAAPGSFDMARGAIFGAVMAFIGAALIL